MQHSHDALDRPGGIGRGQLLSPLRHRDFRVLWTGMTVSLVGDGIFLIAIAWESYALWNAPAALAIVSIGMTIPTIAFLLVGGVVSDRRDRRLVMAWADGLRALAVTAVGGRVFARALGLCGRVGPPASLRRGAALFRPAFAAARPPPAARAAAPRAQAAGHSL